MEAAAEPRELLAPGTMLDDKYRVEGHIATGGMGAVYVGTHTKLRKRVAIKVLNPQLSSAQMLERFHREAITASQIGHEGIVQVMDLGTSTRGEPFLVMEFLEGESLAERLKVGGPMPIELACELGCAILSPLAAAHQAGIVHRDLKPDNVFLVRQSRGEMVKLLDFGISRTAGLEAEFRLTTTGLVLGTPYYMSPEQARGDTDITPAADIYAFGVMLYEMLVGSVPIRGDNYNQLMYRVMTGDYVRPTVRRPDVRPELEMLIIQAMALEPEQRPRSAAALEQALLAFCRPTFREHTIERISNAGITYKTPMHLTPAPLTGQPAGQPAGPQGYDPTVAAPTPPMRAMPAKRGNGRRAAIILAIAIGGIAGGVFAITKLMSDDKKPDAPPPAVASGAAPAETKPAETKPAETKPAETKPAETVPAETKPAEPATITLKLAIEPANAAVTIDDAPVKGPEITVPRDTAQHLLRITAPGYVAHEEKLEYGESQKLVVQLKRAATPGRPTRDRPPPTNNGKGDRIESESPYK